MKITITTTGTTKGHEYYYGDICLNNKVIDSWYCCPNPRRKNIYKFRNSNLRDTSLTRLISRRINNG